MIFRWVEESAEVTFEQADMMAVQTFLRQFRPDASGTNFTTVLVNGGQNLQSDPGVEVSFIVACPAPLSWSPKANLDIQFAVGISHPTPNIYYRYRICLQIR